MGLKPSVHGIAFQRTRKLKTLLAERGLCYEPSIADLSEKCYPDDVMIEKKLQSLLLA